MMTDAEIVGEHLIFAGFLPTHEPMVALDRLTVERDRYRAALEKILLRPDEAIDIAHAALTGVPA